MPRFCATLSAGGRAMRCLPAAHSALPLAFTGPVAVHCIPRCSAAALACHSPTVARLLALPLPRFLFLSWLHLYSVYLPVLPLLLPSLFVGYYHYAPATFPITHTWVLPASSACLSFLPRSLAAIALTRCPHCLFCQFCLVRATFLLFCISCLPCGSQFTFCSATASATPAGVPAFA